MENIEQFEFEFLFWMNFWWEVMISLLNKCTKTECNFLILSERSLEPDLWFLLYFLLANIFLELTKKCIGTLIVSHRNYHNN